MPEGAIVLGVGASAGLGAALCRRFGREGLHVFAAGRTPGRLDAAVEAVKRGGGAATAVPTDATRPEDVRLLFERCQAETGSPPEAVLYNAGNNLIAKLADMDEALFEKAWRTCCFGGMLVAREAARRMAPLGRGSLLFTGATASSRSRPPFVAFASAKAALRAVAAGAARELGPQGVHVGHVIVDGVIDGDMVASRFPQLLEQKGRDGLLQPDDIAGAFWMLHTQPRSAWTFELDLRPHKEPF